MRNKTLKKLCNKRRLYWVTSAEITYADDQQIIWMGNI